MINAYEARLLTRSAILKNIELQIKEAAKCGKHNVNAFIDSANDERADIIKYLEQRGYVVKGLPEFPDANYFLYVPNGFVATDVMTIEWR